MSASRGPIHIIGAGPWGHEVADRLSARTPRPLVSLLDLDASVADLDLRPARVRVLAVGRAVPALAEALDASAHQSQSPWLPVVLAHPHLQIGPAVAPGRGACFSCWQRRLRQHAPAPEVDAALQRYYEAHATELPYGHLPPSAELAAAMAWRVIDRLVSDPGAEAGWLRQINLVSRHMSKGRGVGVHGCVRCGLGRNEPGRAHERLSVAMGQALGWAS
jgi:bacteriocin biosynthesis cyclodehydratase domain-containing protein